MEINFNGNIGMRHAATGADIGGVGQEVNGASGGPRQPHNLEITTGVTELVSAEPVADVPESALSRDDDLGKLMGAVFNLPPPPMPDFRA